MAGEHVHLFVYSALPHAWICACRAMIPAEAMPADEGPRSSGWREVAS